MAQIRKLAYKRSFKYCLFFIRYRVVSGANFIDNKVLYSLGKSPWIILFAGLPLRHDSNLG